MRINKLLYINIFCLVLSFIGCNFFTDLNEVINEDFDSRITAVELDKTSLSLNVGESEYIKLNLTPYEHQSKNNIEWIYDDAFFNVNSDNFGAIVTAKKAGSSYIKAKCNGIIATCIINNIEINDDLTNPYIYSDYNVIQLKPGDSTTITSSLFGGTMEDMELFTWEIENNEIADISFSRNNCIVTAKKVGSTQIHCKHPLAKYEYSFIVFCYSDNFTEPYITTDYNVISINKNIDSIKKIVVDMVNPVSNTYKSLFKWSFADEQSKNIISLNASANEAEIIPLSNGIAKIKVSHENCEYDLDIIVRVSTIVDNTYIDVPSTLIVTGSENSYTLTAQLKNYNGLVDPALFVWDVPQDAAELFEYTTNGNCISIKGKKNGKIKISVSHELAAFPRSILIILQEQIGSAIDSSMYITTDQNYVQTKVGNSPTKIGVRLIGGIDGQDNIGDESTNFTWWIKGNSNVVEVRNVTGVVKSRSAVNSGNSCNAMIEINPISAGEISIFVSHPRCLYETEIKVKVYAESVLVNPLVISSSESVIKLLKNQSKEISVSLRNHKEGDENKIQWSSENESIISISPKSGKTTQITAIGNGANQTYVTATLEGALADKKILVLSAESQEALDSMKGIYADTTYLRITSGERKEIYVNSFGLSSSDRITWTTGDSSLCIVNPNTTSDNYSYAEVIGIKEGKTTIVATIEGCAAVVFDVTILKEGESSEIYDENAGYLTTQQNAVVVENIDDSVDLSVTGVNISSVDMQLHTVWEVDNTSVFSISGSGPNAVLTALEKGKSNVFIKNKMSENSLSISAKCGELYEWTDGYVIYITTENDVINIINGTKHTFGCALANTTSEGEFSFAVTEGQEVIDILGSKSGTCTITTKTAGQAIISVTNTLTDVSKEILVNVGNTEEELNGFKYLTTEQNVVTIPLNSSTSVSVDINNSPNPVVSGYSWTVADPNIISVSNSGNIGVMNGLKIGTTKITVMNEACIYPLEIICNVVDEKAAIIDPYISAKSIATCYIDSENVILTAELVGGTDADNSGFTWSVEDDSIATVYGSNNTASVKGLSEGVTTVFVSHPKAHINRKILIIVEPKKLQSCYISTPESIIKLVPGTDKRTISATLVGGSEEDYYNFKWWADNYNIIDMDYNGNSCLITPLLPGVVNLNVSHPKAAVPKTIVLYISKYNDFAFETNAITIENGKDYFINMEVPATYLDCDISFDSEPKNICDTTGNNSVCILQPRNEGNCVITASLLSKGGSVQAKTELLVNVKKREEASPYITITNPSSSIITLQKGKSQNLTATLKNSNNNDSDLVWNVKEEGMLSFNGTKEGSNVQIKAERAGKTIITVSHKTDKTIPVETLYVIVQGENDTTITLNPQTLKLYMGENKKNIVATINNAKEGSLDELKWDIISKTQNVDVEQLCTFTTSGTKAYISPKKVGQVQVSCTLPSAGFTAYCDVTIAETEKFNFFVYDQENNYTCSGDTIINDKRNRRYISNLNLIPNTETILHYESIPEKDSIEDIYIYDSYYFEAQDMKYITKYKNILYPNDVGTILINAKNNEGTSILKATTQSLQSDSVTITNSYGHYFSLDKSIIVQTPEEYSGQDFYVNYEIRPGIKTEIRIIPQGEQSLYANLGIKNATWKNNYWVIDVHKENSETMETNIYSGQIEFYPIGGKEFNADLTIEAWNNGMKNPDGSAASAQKYSTQSLKLGCYYNQYTFDISLLKAYPCLTSQCSSKHSKVNNQTKTIVLGDGETCELKFTSNQQNSTPRNLKIEFERNNNLTKKDKRDGTGNTQADRVNGGIYNSNTNIFTLTHNHDYAIYRYKNGSNWVEVNKGMENLYCLDSEANKTYEVLNENVKESSYVGNVVISYTTFTNENKTYKIPVYVEVRNTPCASNTNYYY